MSTGAIIGIIIAVIVVIAAAMVVAAGLRRARMRRQFGPEYDRLAQELGSRKAGTELAARQRRVQALGIHELSPDQQARYSGDWAAIQEGFVDTPIEAVGAAHTLIWNVMRDRGYPADDRNASLEALSVHHARALAGYRQTMDLRTESATTEQLREAMIRYRALFEDLTGLREVREQPGRDRVAGIRGQAAGTGGQAAGTGGAVTGNQERAAENTGRMAPTSDPIAENSDVATQNADRTAETPR
ncbi:MAG: hypothetical protein JO037_18465 [Actinobacteria bacterium]|nr:hypothetical protein [Actinomycetota bacterium]